MYLEKRRGHEGLESPNVGVLELLGLRWRTNGTQAIATRLQLQGMIPSDRLKTKIEILSFVEWGGIKRAHDLIKQAAERVKMAQGRERAQSLKKEIASERHQSTQV